MYACYTVLDNALTLRESLNSILPYVEKVIAVDGAWKGFPHKHASSTDDTRKIFHELCGDKLIWIDCNGKHWPSEVHARNQYAQRVPIGKWYLEIDGDEYVKGNVEKAFKSAEFSDYICMGILGVNFKPIWRGLVLETIRGNPCFIYTDKPIREEDWDDLQWQKFTGTARRVYRKLEGFRYAHGHCTAWVGKSRVRIQAMLKDVELVNMPQKRGWTRWHENYIYKKDMR